MELVKARPLRVDFRNATTTGRFLAMALLFSLSTVGVARHSATDHQAAEIEK